MAAKEGYSFALRPSVYCDDLTGMEMSSHGSLALESDADREMICMISQTKVQVTLCIIHPDSAGASRNTLVHSNHGAVTAARDRYKNIRAIFAESADENKECRTSPECRRGPAGTGRRTACHQVPPAPQRRPVPLSGKLQAGAPVLGISNGVIDNSNGNFIR